MSLSRGKVIVCVLRVLLWMGSGFLSRGLRAVRVKGGCGSCQRVPGLVGRIVAIPTGFWLCGPSETTRAVSNGCVM